MFEEIEGVDDEIVAPGHHPQIFASFTWESSESSTEATTDSTDS